MVRLAQRLPIEEVEVRAYTVPTSSQPESDGTLEWGSTTLILVTAVAGGQRGLGYGYTDAAAAVLIRDRLVCDAFTSPSPPTPRPSSTPTPASSGPPTPNRTASSESES